MSVPACAWPEDHDVKARISPMRTVPTIARLVLFIFLLSEHVSEHGPHADDKREVPRE
jgi:hypothetical protein